MKMLLEIGSVDNVEAYVKDALARKKKIMGFGHAVYRTDDPRATHLRRLSKEMGERKGNTKWYDMTAKVEEVMKREKGLLPNVDAYSASTYYMMGIPLDLYTPIFAISRISGWTAHILEQYANNKLIRPRAEYIGPRNVPYVRIDVRWKSSTRSVLINFPADQSQPTQFFGSNSERDSIKGTLDLSSPNQWILMWLMR